ncbi:MAG TPA: sugar ABC transporter substrate-binding protein [Thermoanaerobaculia bacterium]|nr:sugar ABC transporter substrate-binding protein [Thermoanaerobaculia bacterium]
MNRYIREIWISLLGSLGAGLVFLFFGFLFPDDIWSLRVPFWLLPLTVALLVFPFIYALRKLRRTEEPHNVLVMLSAFERHTYFAEVLRYIIACLDETPARDGLTLQAVVNAPRAQYNRANQLRHLNEALRRRHEYVGALIVPVDPNNAKGDLAEFVQRFERPVVFFDTNPCLQPAEYTPGSCFVGVDDRAGGQLAAAAMVHELRRLDPPVARPRILVLPGGFHEAREECFAEVVRRELAGAVVETANPSYFDRDKARRLARNLLAEAAEKRLSYDGAFCTGDEMALGFIEAVRERNGSGVSERLVVIGYDGINEARRLLDRRESPLKNTVVQDSQQLGESVVFQMTTRHKQDRARDSSPEIFLKPRLYHSLAETP